VSGTSLTHRVWQSTKTDSFALLVHRPIELFSNTIDLDVRLIHPPAFTDGVLVVPEGLFQQGQEPDRLPIA
jgi:hypothetical protein